MRLQLLLLFIIFSTISSAQDQDMILPQEKERKLSVGVFFSADYAYSEYKTSDDDLIGYVDRLIELYKGKVGYTTGVNVKYEINSLFAMETGIQYSNKGYKLDWGQLTFGDQIDDRRGFIYTTNEIPRGGNINHNYLDIPIRVIYQSGQKKIKFLSSIGLIGNYRLNINGNSLNANGGNERYNPRNFSASFSAGIAYQIKKNISLTIEPTYRHGLFETEYGSIGTYLHNAGLNFGSYYAIK